MKKVYEATVKNGKVRVRKIPDEEKVKAVKKKIKKIFIITILSIILISVAVLLIWIFRAQLNFTYAKIKYNGPADVLTAVYIIKENGMVYKDTTDVFADRIDFVGEIEPEKMKELKKYIEYTKSSETDGYIIELINETKGVTQTNIDYISQIIGYNINPMHR